MPLGKTGNFQAIPLILRVSAGSPARNGAVTDLSRSFRLSWLRWVSPSNRNYLTIQRLGHSLLNFRFGIAHANRRGVKENNHLSSEFETWSKHDTHSYSLLLQTE